MTKQEIDRLATYNMERGKGLIHTPEYDERMRALQEEYNKQEGNAMSTETTAEYEDAEVERIAENTGLDEDVVKAGLAAGVDEGDLEEAYQGTFTSDKEFALDMVENMGSMKDGNEWPYTCINWEWAADELMMDYVEQDGYYFRVM